MTLRTFVAATLLAACTTAFAQATATPGTPPASGPRAGIGPGMGPGMGPGGRPASGPMGPGMGRGPASGPGMGPGWRAGPDNTPGWSMMTPEERAAHQQRMQGMTSHADCTAYMDQHHQQMAARAAQRGASAPTQPRRDMCAGLK
ncbi:MAG TPA: hypothetical protein VFK10_07665 [Burkholderiaceae bacterium]|nr:hypothetical protein [Burkholderiaceae bacterium]